MTTAPTRENLEKLLNKLATARARAHNAYADYHRYTAGTFRSDRHYARWMKWDEAYDAALAEMRAALSSAHPEREGR